MNERTVLLFAPGRLPPEGEIDRYLEGWSIHVSRSVGELERSLRRPSPSRVTVGILWLLEGSLPLLDELDGLLRNVGTVKWIAVLERGLLCSSKVSRFIQDHCVDYHTLPLDAARLATVLGHAHGFAQLDEPAKPTDSPIALCHGMVGNSLAMQQLYAELDKVSKSEAAVLIHGESGTGKELIARAIHRQSSRSNGPFLAVNCGAIPIHLVQSELFGHEKGSFTGAHQRKIGLLEAAHRGTILLDEIGDLQHGQQVHLLRFLQEQTVERVGSVERIKVDVRVLAATHVDLKRAIEEGRFRADLFYRLNVLSLQVPPLREREGDVELLANWCLQQFASERCRRLQGFSQNALRAMCDYAWPGNVRELINCVHRAIVMCENRQINPDDLGLAEHNGREITFHLQLERDRAEREVVERALLSNQRNVAATARQLGLSRSTLYRLMDRLNLKS